MWYLFIFYSTEAELVNVYIEAMLELAETEKKKSL